jgi:sugar phosphate isomerase/epimerase
MLSITTDYVKDTGCPAPFLEKIAAAGFSHVHWCHHWNTDFIYSRHEIKQIKKWLGDFGLKLLDLHASAGVEKNWGSLAEYERLSGVELVLNRLEMSAELGGDAIVMHLPAMEQNSLHREPLYKSLDALLPAARELKVNIAVENGSFEALESVFNDYPDPCLGLCYDSGHGNMGAGRGLMDLDRLKSRLMVVHLHDNDGVSDLHRPMFTGTVDWNELAGIIAGSAYDKCPSTEANMRRGPGNETEEAFLSECFQACEKFAGMTAAFKGEKK